MSQYDVRWLCISLPITTSLGFFDRPLTRLPISDDPVRSRGLTSRGEFNEHEKTASGQFATTAGVRPSATKPQLLTELPGSLFASPGFIMGLIAVEFLYGLFLFAVMSTSKRHREEAGRPQPNSTPTRVRFQPPLALKIEAEVKPEPVAKAEPAAKPETTASTRRNRRSSPRRRKPRHRTAQRSPRPRPRSEPPQTTNSKASQKSKNDKNEVALVTPEPTPTKVEAVAKSCLLFPELGPLSTPWRIFSPQDGG